MKKIFFLKHSMMAMNDPRMKKLLKVEKLKGIGAYWFILERLELLPEPRAQLDYLKPFCSKEVPFYYIRKIILEYDLFEFDEEDYFMPVELNPIHKKTEIVSKTARKTIEFEQKTTETTRKTAQFEQKSTKIARKSAKINRKNDENKPEFAKKRVDFSNSLANNQLICSNLQQNPTTVNKEYIKDIIITTEKERKKEKEETAAAADISIPMENSAALPPTPTPPTLTCCDDWGRPQRPLQPVLPWKQLADKLTESSQWLEIACLKSCYADLLMRNIHKAVEIFKQHIEVYDKGGQLLTMSDIRQYFTNFVNAGSRTSRSLRDALLALEAKEHPADKSPYRYEERCNGKRTYMGCPIPDDAPPRPDATATWNEDIQRWITLLKTPHLSSGNDTAHRPE